MFSDKLSESKPVFLVTAKDVPTGRDAWWYVKLINKLKLPIFMKKMSTEGCNISEYGEIISSGFGKEPPKEIQEKMNSQNS